MFIKVELNNKKKILPNCGEMPVELIMEKLEIESNHALSIPEKPDLHVLDIGSAFIKTPKLDVAG